MDAYEIVNVLNQVLDMGDRLDDTGVVGVKALSDGQYTTREVCRLELSRFLIYIASGNGSFTDGEVALINIVIGQEYSAFQLKQIASTTDEPTPSCMTLMGFLTADIELSRQSGVRTTTTTDFLISVYETFGNLMVAFDENQVSKARCVKFINGMKTYVMKNL